MTAFGTNAWERWLALYLRVSAFVLISAIVAAGLPLAIMARLHDAIGMGDMPQAPIVSYLARSGSAMYVMLGLIYWRISRHVGRYLDLIRFLGLIKLAFGFGILAIDRAVGMPTWWIWTEGPFIIGWSAMLLWLVSKTREEVAHSAGEENHGGR